LFYVQNVLFPFPKEVADWIENLTRQLYDRPFIQVIGLLAFLPALCEETTFRGVVLTGMATRYKPVAAMMITAFLFAVFHLSLNRFIAVFLIGLGATFLVWRSGSIFVGMLLHALCNGYVSFVAVYPKFDWFHILAMRPSPVWFITGVVVAA